MESDQPHPLPALPAPETSRCCSCNYQCCASRATWRRSVKRRHDDAFAAPSPASIVVVEEEVPAARVEADNEVAALREALVSHQQTVQELFAELEEERSAASTAASEAMSMILRLQREKAEAQMECRQFKRLAEERMAHDQCELATLDDLLLRRDHALRSLSLQLQSYRLRLLSFGIDPDSLDLYSAADLPGTPTTLPSGTPKANADGPLPAPFNYPPLRCNIPGDLEEDYYEEDENMELENYCETPLIHEDLRNLHYRVNLLERNPSMPPLNCPVAARPAPAEHLHQSSTDSFNSREELPNRGTSYCDDGDDGDRVYTIDAVHGPPVVASVCNERIDLDTSVNESKGTSWVAGGEEEADVKNLYARLQALEADRESMRQALISMRTEKAQFVLLREIAQHLCKEVVAPKKVIKKQASFIQSISVLSVAKWILSFVFWKRKATRSKYTFGHSNNNNGLLLLLERSPRMGHWRLLSRLLE